LILRGTEAWNKWREQNKSGVDFTRPHWYALDFSGMHLTNASIYNALAEGLKFRNAKIVDCIFEEGDFS
jgi:uncharacterized protein YjbI with pentapeptide repeats